MPDPVLKRRAETMARFKAATVQVNASNDLQQNLKVTSDLIRRAAERGAEFITTPEVVLLIGAGAADTRAKAFHEADHPGIPAFADLARETGAWLSAGSFSILLDEADDDRLANRSYLFAPDGSVAARYDKIHMFDVNLSSGEAYKESRVYRPGTGTQLVDLPWGRLGLTICYDMRFPKLYRDLAQAGAEILTVPSAFTRPTGRAHWHVLLRARAIETGCFVIAAAQCGTHAKGRQTYGHSLIVAPWGEVLSDGGEEVGINLAEIDMDQVVEARRRVPSLEHDRDYAAPVLADPLANAAE